MKLVTKNIEKEFGKYPFYSQEGKAQEAEVIAKFFLCAGAWTWYVLEAEKLTDGSYNCFGITINGQGEGEYGYFNTGELQSVRTRLGMTVERDIYFEKKVLKDITEDKYLSYFLNRIYSPKD